MKGLRLVLGYGQNGGSYFLRRQYQNDEAPLLRDVLRLLKHCTINRCVSSFAVLILSRVRGMVECDWSPPSPPTRADSLVHAYPIPGMQRSPAIFKHNSVSPRNSKPKFLHDVPSKSITPFIDLGLSGAHLYRLKPRTLLSMS